MLYILHIERGAGLIAPRKPDNRSGSNMRGTHRRKYAVSNQVTVTVAIDLKPEHADSFFDGWLPQLQEQTLAFEGVRSARAVRRESRVLFIDIFDSVEAARKYFDWREKSGDLNKLGELLVSPPQVEFWPISRDPR